MLLSAMHAGIIIFSKCIIASFVKVCQGLSGLVKEYQLFHQKSLSKVINIANKEIKTTLFDIFIML